jgi:hypothetical protein
MPNDKEKSEVAVSVPSSAEREAEERIAKLQLEQVALKRQMSPSGRGLEWLKAASAPVALIALLWTVIAGVESMKQGRRAAVDERFDKAITRMASPDGYQRLTGITGLRQFLSDPNHEADAVSYLVTALAVEKDPILRDAILDSISQLKADGTNPETIQRGLEIAIERNRKLAKSVDIGKDDLDGLPAGDPRLAALHATSLAMVSLIRQGAHGGDLSDVYCAECDFSGSNVNLSGTKFDRAILREADFSDAILENSSFDGANILAGC